MQDCSSRKPSWSDRNSDAAARTRSFTNLLLSAHKIARASMPFTQSGLEFEPMQSHPFPYTAETSGFAAMASLRGLETRALFRDMGVQSMQVPFGFVECAMHSICAMSSIYLHCYSLTLFRRRFTSTACATANVHAEPLTCPTAEVLR